jgi:hypothetical protein
MDTFIVRSKKYGEIQVELDNDVPEILNEYDKEFDDRTGYIVCRKKSGEGRTPDYSI